MIEFQAAYYDGRSSARNDVRVRGYATVLQIVGEGLRVEVPLASVAVDPPVGSARRALRLPGGALLQTDDAAAVEALFPGVHAIEGWVHAMERRWPYALGAIAAIAGITWWGVVDGLPRAAKVVSGFVSAPMEARLGEQTLALFEGKVCRPSALAPGANRRCSGASAASPRGWTTDFPTVFSRGTAAESARMPSRSPAVPSY